MKTIALSMAMLALAGAVVSVIALNFVMGIVLGVTGVTLWLLGTTCDELEDLRAEIGGVRKQQEAAESRMKNQVEELTALIRQLPGAPMLEAGPGTANTAPPTPEPTGPWTCAQCGEKSEPPYTACWKCGTQREPGRPASTPGR